MVHSGRVLSVRDAGTIWQLFYAKDDSQGLGVLNFDHRQFAHMYESLSGRSFARDYALAAGRDVILRYFVGETITVDERRACVWFE